VSLWAVTMVRDELDVLPLTLLHLLNEGVDGMVIADNRSVDGTREWLHEFAQDAPIPVDLLHDDEVAYYQSRKMSAYYRRASEAGADWVIPFDADEVWYDAEGATLREVFARPWDMADCLEVKVFNHFPTSLDDADEGNPFRRITRRDPTMSIMAKTAVRGSLPSLVIEQGNHQAHAAKALRIVRPELEIGHFPWRSPEQFERKARNGAEAYAAATDTSEVPLSQGEHWRDYGRILNEHGPAALRGVYDKWFFDPPINLEHKPVPWRAMPP
jgi:glycosyltransferase involved in cell wall biosynthesis